GLNMSGWAVLGGFVVVGLAIWTAILSPAPSKPPLGPAAAKAAPEMADTGAPAAQPPNAEARKMMDDLERKAKASPNDAQAWNKLGLVYVLAAERDPSYYPQARSAFEHVLEIDPTDGVALRGLANVHHGRGEYKKAIEYYDRYLTQQPDDDAV